jgi:hypothetical protein
MEQGVCGVSAAFLSSIFYGPIGSIAFAVGSSIGWIAAAIYGWHTSVAHSLIAYDQYPKLMLIHMMRSFRLMGLERVKLDSPDAIAKFRHRLVTDLRYKSMLVGAYETAAPLIDVSPDNKIERIRRFANLGLRRLKLGGKQR